MLGPTALFMQLLYSTSDLSAAEHLSRLLADANVANHITNTHSAQMPGFSARLTPGFVGVWLVNSADLSTAREVMQAHGFLVESSARAPTTRPSSGIWFKLGIAALVAAVVVAVVASGP